MLVFERVEADGSVVSSSARYEMTKAVSSGGRLFNDMSELGLTSCTWKSVNASFGSDSG